MPSGGFAKILNKTKNKVCSTEKEVKQYDE